MFKVFFLFVVLYIHVVKTSTTPTGVKGTSASTSSLSVKIELDANLQRHAYHKYTPIGGVYVMTNSFVDNTVLAYSRMSNGQLTYVGEYRTAGNGTFVDAGEGVNPLMAAYSLIITDDNKFVIACNAGSSSVALFRIESDFSLSLTHVVEVNCFVPLSLASAKGFVYVACEDADFEFTTDASKRGSLYGFKILPITGKLLRIKNSFRQLINRPAAIKFSQTGRVLMVTSIYSGIQDVNTTDINELYTYRMNKKTGLLTNSLVSTVTSTKLSDVPEKRYLPSPIGFTSVKMGNKEYVIVPESRVYIPSGQFIPQTPSISTWRLKKRGGLKPIQLDYVIGDEIKPELIAAAWIAVSDDENVFWAVNTGENGIGAFSFNNGIVKIIKRKVGEANFPIDIWKSADGKYLYQLALGYMLVFEIDSNGYDLNVIQNVSRGIPPLNVQGVVAF